MKNKLKCPYCGEELHLSIGYTGCDWNTVAGENSGYGWELSLDCKNVKCAYIFPLGGLKNVSAFSERVENLRPYAGRLND